MDKYLLHVHSKQPYTPCIATIIDKKSWHDTACRVVFNSYIVGKS